MSETSKGSKKEATEKLEDAPVKANWASCLILVPCLLPMQVEFYLLYLIGLAFLQFVFLKHQFKLKRELLFNAYVDSKSKLQRFNRDTQWSTYLAIPLAAFLCIYTSLHVYTQGWIYTLALVVGIIVGSSYGNRWADYWLKHARSHLRPYFQAVFTICMSVAFAAIATIIANCVMLLGDYSAWSPAMKAAEANSQHVHPVKGIQNFARTVTYGEITILKLRDSFEHGWIIYLWMLMPKIITIYGASIAIHGLNVITNRWRK